MSQGEVLIYPGRCNTCCRRERLCDIGVSKTIVTVGPNHAGMEFGVTVLSEPFSFMTHLVRDTETYVFVSGGEYLMMFVSLLKK